MTLADLLEQRQLKVKEAQQKWIEDERNRDLPLNPTDQMVPLPRLVNANENPVARSIPYASLSSILDAVYRGGAGIPAMRGAGPSAVDETYGYDRGPREGRFAGNIAVANALRGNHEPSEEYAGFDYGPYSGAVRGEGAAYRAQNGIHYDPFADEHPGAWLGSVAGNYASRLQAPQMGSNAPINKPILDRQSILNAFIR